MRLTTQTRYGTRAMLDLALHHGRGPISSGDIAAHQDLSIKYLEHLLARLRDAGLVRTLRGSQGGHLLDRRPEEINLRQIFEVFEGTDGLVPCTTNDRICARYQGCVTREIWAEMYAASMDVLESTSLLDLVRRAREKRDSLVDMYYI